ncbi:MAG TPA: hypothetical protein VIU93_15435 [Gallionellaceae bacterium]
MLKLLKYFLIFVILSVTVRTLMQKFFESNADEKIIQSVKDGNTQLPKMMNEFVRADKLEYSDRVVRFYATVIGTREIFDKDKSSFEDLMRGNYCAGNMNLYARANVSIAYVIKYTSAIYGDTEWDFKITPASCGRR